LGALLDNVLLEFATLERTPLLRKQAILSTLKDVFGQPQAVMDLYYNYDNVSGWAVFDRLIGVISSVLENSPASGMC